MSIREGTNVNYTFFVSEGSSEAFICFIFLINAEVKLLRWDERNVLALLEELVLCGSDLRLVLKELRRSMNFARFLIPQGGPKITLVSANNKKLKQKLFFSSHAVTLQNDSF